MQLVSDVEKQELCNKVENLSKDRGITKPKACEELGISPSIYSYYRTCMNAGGTRAYMERKQAERRGRKEAKTGVPVVRRYRQAPELNSRMQQDLTQVSKPIQSPQRQAMLIELLSVQLEQAQQTLSKIKGE